jgi:hypothetical protein
MTFNVHLLHSLPAEHSGVGTDRRYEIRGLTPIDIRACPDHCQLNIFELSHARNIIKNISASFWERRWVVG